MTFKTDKKSGFKSVEKEVEIYRKIDGIFQPFYYFKSSQPFYFNLPRGEYKTDSKIIKAKRAKKYNLKPPKNERRIIPNRFRIYYIDNPNKASINAATGNIFLDKKLFNEIEFTTKIFILFHEIAHCYYKTEWKCDRMSAYLMLRMGFNPSQIARAPKESLNCQDRKNKVINELLNQ